MNLCFVVPVYNERETLTALTEGITEHAEPHEHRILFVDDGSTDGSYDVLCELRAQYEAVDVIKLRRNYGKTRALAVAFERAEGDVVITMDADLQDDPKEIPKFLEKLDEGFDLVCGWKVNRKDPWHKTIPSRVYNFFIAKAFRLKLHDINSGFKAMRIEVAKRLPLYGDMHRMIAVYAAHMGYRVDEVEVKHHPRRHGQSKYGAKRLPQGALDAFATWFVTRYGQSPGHYYGGAGHAALFLGLLTFLCAAATGAYLFHQNAGMPGRELTSAVIVLLLVLTGFVIAALGAVLVSLGLLAELLVHRIPPPPAERYVHKDPDE